MHNTTMSKAIYESFRTKASILQSKGAMARAELDATGMTTKRTEAKAERSVESEAERAVRVSAMKAMNAKKKATG
jgi:hypothetical protein